MRVKSILMKYRLANMKQQLENLNIQIDRKLKDKMWDYYKKTRKSLRLQTEEALEMYFQAKRKI